MKSFFAITLMFFTLQVEAKMKMKTELAYLAGGCFWGVEELIRKLPGVVQTDVGYTGGNTSQVTYAQVKLGNTGNAEAVRIEYDPGKISYGEILDYFFRIHDPTTVDRQGNDVGTQYRSAIFYADPKQKEEARKAIDRAEKSGRWKGQVVTRLEAYNAFTLAEDYHQDYLQKNPTGYTCHWVRK